MLLRSSGSAPLMRFFSVVMFALAGAMPASPAAEFQIELGEAMDWLAPDAAMTPSVPANAPERTVYPLAPERVESLLSELPGRPFLVVDPPPTSTAYWKYPIYAVLGFPRDLVDSVFGFFSFWPIVNIPLVGVAYEIVPTQALMRDPRDWHRWPGSANRRGHGFFPSKSRTRDATAWGSDQPVPVTLKGDKLFNETWGWFPTAHSMSFTYTSQAKLEKYKRINERLHEELQLANAEIDTRNRAIAERQRQVRQAAVAAIDRGDGHEATARMLPYHMAYPVDDQGHALLLNALALYGDSGPEWVRPWLLHELQSVDLSVLRQAEILMEKSHKDFPASHTLAEALVFANSRRGDYGRALATARAAFESDPTSARRARLLFEAGAGARDKATVASAISTMRSIGVDEAELRVLSLRQRLLEGKAADARPELTSLVQGHPENPYYRYYLGCAEIETIEEAKVPEAAMQSAMTELERASLTAGTRPLQERAGRALTYVRSLTSAKVRTDKKEKPLININLENGILP